MKNLPLAVTLCLGVVALAPTAALADSPREFLHHSLQGDNSEIMLGRLAADRGRSPGVRAYGRTLARDHETARIQVLEVGRRYGIRADRDVMPEARDERDKLLGMPGREFDREFVRYMVDDHHKDIEDFREQARADRGDVSALARNQLPTLRKHLAMAKALDRREMRNERDFRDHEVRDQRGEHRYDR